MVGIMGEFEQIREVLTEIEMDEPLTAREIREALEERGADIGSTHRIATVLGRRARHGEVEVVRGRPYRYRLDE